MLCCAAATQDAATAQDKEAEKLAPYYPTPETVVCEDFTTAMAAIREMGDTTVKPIFGSMGHGLVRITDADIAF